MQRKRFDRELYLLNDQKAKKAVLKYLGKGWGENPKKTGVDLVNIINTAFVECEIKQRFIGKEFPYETVQLPERKGKWKDLNIRYFILNKQCTYAIIIYPKSLKDSRLKEVPNKYVFKGEYFYQIPVKECDLVKL